MTSAKPQQMTGQKPDPDDLIAELTKLMASDGRGSAADRRDPPVVRSAEPPARPVGPQTVRIPGVSQPVVASPAAGRFDDSRNSSATPEPLANWKDRLGAASQTTPSTNALANRREPTVGADAWRSSVANVEAAPANNPSGFEFDFGFNRRPPDGPTSPAGGAKAVVPPVATQPAHDAIAELIAAELDSVLPAAVTAPRPAAAPPQSATPPALSVVPRQAVGAPVQSLSLQPEAPRPAPSRNTPESDRFVTAPVFGLGSRPADDATNGKADRDPIDEIESLIGEAVRVELNAPPPPPMARSYEPTVVGRTASPEAQPVVPPASTQFAPRKTGLREPLAAPGIDAAILEAAAATGAEVGRIEMPHADDAPMPQRRRARRVREDRRSGGALRNFIIPVVAGTILVAIGFGLFWALGMGGRHAGTAPILSASLTPAKTIPPKPVDTAPRSVVMQELSGTAPAAAQETLQSRDQTAGDNAAQIAAATPAPAAAAAADGGLANRKVRTVTVRPDGTIISSDGSVAGSAELPVVRPNVPAVPGVSVADASDALPPITPSTAMQPAAPATSAIAPTTPPGTQVASVTPSTALPAISSPTDVAAPLPMARALRPEDSSAAADSSQEQPTSAANAEIRPAATSKGKPFDLIGNLAASSDDQSPAAVTPASTRQVASVDSSMAATGAAAHVQLSSQPSQAAAQASAASLERRFGSLFNGAHLSIVKVDLGAKGVRYRVVMPASSLSGAKQLCTSIKSSGGDCVAANG